MKLRMKNIVVQEMTGGLGNQMFEYAFIKSLALRNKVDFRLDISAYKTYFRPYELEIFSIEKKYTTIQDIPFYQRWDMDSKLKYYLKMKSGLRLLLKILNPYHHDEFMDYFNKPQIYHENLKDLKKGYFTGVFPSELYFIDQRDNIKKDFKFIGKISSESELIRKNIESNNSVSIHIRRGDYLNLQKVYRILDKKYYLNAIDIINQKVDHPTFVFFSNDIDRTRKTFSELKNSIFVSHNRGKDNWQDMYLMSRCKHNIIANSSFSWWGAYLNNNPGKCVVAPQRCFVDGCKYNYNNINPTSWIAI